MNDFIDIVEKLTQSDSKLVLARVIKTWGSSPRPVGSAMLINPEGNMAGSVSGGCVEGSVVKKSLSLLENHENEKVSYGVSDEEAWEAGLSCGGSIDVLLQSIDFSEAVWKALKENIIANKSCILVTTLKDGSKNMLIDEDERIVGESPADELVRTAQRFYKERRSGIAQWEGEEYFIHVFPRKELLLIIGAAHITVDLVSFGNQMGFETVVIDPRGFFARKTVFRDPPARSIEAYPSEILRDFPLDAYTYCAVLSHDPKIDDNALEILLLSNVGYIGALGSRKTHARRVSRLQEKGISQELIDKIHAPIGLNIHAKTAKEIALSIISQIIEVRNEHLSKK